MNGVSDETLMAYVDGELADDQARAVEHFLATHPEAAQRLSVFEGTGRNLGALLDGAIPEQLPERLISAVRADVSPVSWPFSSPDSSPDSSNVIPLRKVTAPPNSTRSPRWAIAAGLALVAGGSALWLSHTSTQPPQGFDLASVVDPSGSAREGLKLALDTVTSNSSAKIAGLAIETVIRPEFTFTSKSGTFCRQYILTQREASVAGVACRRDGGVWHAELHGPIKSNAAQTPGQIVPAGRETSQDIDALVDRLISGDVLSTLAEAGMIKNGWRKTTGQ